MLAGLVTQSVKGSEKHHFLNKLFEGNVQAALGNGRKATKKEKALGLREIVIYIAFILIFTLTNGKGLSSPTAFQFGDAVHNQVLRSEFLDSYAPNNPKTFFDIATVGELQQWMVGPLSAFLFSTGSFDGKSWEGGMKTNTVLSHARFIGPVRISQLRANKVDCTENVWNTFGGGWACYDGAATNTFGAYDLYSFLGGGFENTTAFGAYKEFNYTNANKQGRYDKNDQQIGTKGKFLFDGIDGTSGEPLNGSSVAADRKKFYASFRTQEMQALPYPAFHVTLDPAQGAAGFDTMKDLINSGYIDLATRAVVMDFTLYNPHVDRICWFRAIVEMTESGAVLPTYSYHVVKPWEQTGVTSDDKKFIALQFIVFLFYIYYFLQEVHIYYLYGFKKYFSTWINLAQFVNIVLYIDYYALSFMAYRYGPKMDGSASFHDFSFMARVHNTATNAMACNIFLNWFKTVFYLSMSPSFAILTKTLSKSANKIKEFMIMFFIILWGFAQAHTMVFGTHLRSYRTIGQSVFTLLRSLLGDFDFEEMQYVHPIMGPLFFVLFVSLSIFVLLNILIAIISDSYAEAMDEFNSLSDDDKMSLGHELWVYLKVTWGPCLFRICPCLRMLQRRRVKTMPEAVELATEGSASHVAAAEATDNEVAERARPQDEAKAFASAASAFGFGGKAKAQEKEQGGYEADGSALAASALASSGLLVGPTSNPAAATSGPPARIATTWALPGTSQEATRGIEAHGLTPGDRVSVRWGGNKWFSGIVSEFDTSTGEHVVAYDDGDKRRHDMSKKRFKLLQPGAADGPGELE
jgi:hypothetical protein